MSMIDEEEEERSEGTWEKEERSFSIAGNGIKGEGSERGSFMVPGMPRHSRIGNNATSRPTASSQSGLDES